jgi:hypothetical protein
VSPPPPPATGWNANATAHRGNVGATVAVDCPAGGPLGTVWGSGIYTDDSSICSAAVHAGFITVAAGGAVTIEIRRGEKAYVGTTQNGVTSQRWGSWSGSFSMVSATPGTAPPSGGSKVKAISWTDAATALRGHTGTFEFSCPSGGRASTVWGSGLYTDDSSICTAAVHAGVITTSGGIVEIEMRPGAASYTGTTQNNVTTHRWGGWAGSFVVVGGTAAPAPLVQQANTISWSDTATVHRGQHGLLVTVECPSGGTHSTVWGTIVYTDDSSICTAAVHAGLITTASGGEVTFEILPGEPSYVGTTYAGVATKSYGAWSGSYTFL